MPSIWNTRDESRFSFIKRRELELGKSRQEATEIAVKAVQQQQKEEGRAQALSAGWTGNPNTTLEERTLSELRNIAMNLNINIHHNKMSKNELIAVIRSRRMMGPLPSTPLAKRRGDRLIRTGQKN